MDNSKRESGNELADKTVNPYSSPETEIVSENMESKVSAELIPEDLLPEKTIKRARKSYQSLVTLAVLVLGVGAFLLFGAITLLNKNAQLGIYTTAIAACALLSGLTLAVAAPGTKRGYPTGLKLFTIGYIINLGFLVIGFAKNDGSPGGIFGLIIMLAIIASLIKSHKAMKEVADADLADAVYPNHSKGAGFSTMAGSLFLANLVLMFVLGLGMGIASDNLVKENRQQVSSVENIVVSNGRDAIQELASLLGNAMRTEQDIQNCEEKLQQVIDDLRAINTGSNTRLASQVASYTGALEIYLEGLLHMRRNDIEQANKTFVRGDRALQSAF